MDWVHVALTVVSTAIGVMLTIGPWLWTLQRRLTRMECLLERVAHYEETQDDHGKELQAIDRRVFVLENTKLHTA